MSGDDGYSVSDVEREIAALDDVGWRRLRTAARKAMKRYAVDAGERDENDLVNETLGRMLSGTRTWSKKTDFEYQVAKTMESIASHWGRHDAWVPEVREGELYSRVEKHDEVIEDEPAPLPERVAPERSPEDRAAAKRDLLDFAKGFADDPAALAVLRCFREDLSRREMRQRTGLSEKELGTTIRRIRRRGSQWGSRRGRVWLGALIGRTRPARP